MRVTSQELRKRLDPIGPDIKTCVFDKIPQYSGHLLVNLLQFVQFTMETTKKKAVSGKRCVAAGCSNTKTNTTGVALFLFPKDGGQALLWNKEVKRTRLDWTTHTKYSVLCSEHFEQSCFEEGPLQRAAMDIATTRRLVLKKGAKPTIFNRPRPCLSASSTSSEHPTPSTSGQTVHMRSAFAKRERKKDLKTLTCTLLLPLPVLSHPGNATITQTPPERNRGLMSNTSRLRNISSGVLGPLLRTSVFVRFCYWTDKASGLLQGILQPVFRVSRNSVQAIDCVIKD
ncbi:THAP domain-containing protein 10-like isoform X1 [Entelurus aequoreus]|uniref:THAP domain-containing protein 10-like isoform X1 n=1 Tax=Entelurus aequoreus TaxID=161455 RepID=UPI002B1D82DD|nr:THAP domain-containing protein 10-like isoform X1 [Entelurus aequoreus]